MRSHRLRLLFDVDVHPPRVDGAAADGKGCVYPVVAQALGDDDITAIRPSAARDDRIADGLVYCGPVEWHQLKRAATPRHDVQEIALTTDDLNLAGLDRSGRWIGLNPIVFGTIPCYDVCSVQVPERSSAPCLRSLFAFDIPNAEEPAA